MLHCNAKTNRRTIVKYIHIEPLCMDNVQKFIHDFCKMIKGIIKSIPRGTVALSKTRIIRSNQMKVFLQHRHQIPKHMGCTRETVKQHHDRLIHISAFSVKHIQAIYIYSPKSHCFIPLL